MDNSVDNIFQADCDGGDGRCKDPAATSMAARLGEAGAQANPNELQMLLWRLEKCGVCQPLTLAIAGLRPYAKSNRPPCEFVWLASRRDDWTHEVMPFSRPMTRMASAPFEVMCMALDPQCELQAIAWPAWHLDHSGAMQAVVRAGDSYGVTGSWVVGQDGRWCPVHSDTPALPLLAREHWRDGGIEAEGVAQLARKYGLKPHPVTGKVDSSDRRFINMLRDVTFIQAPAVSSLQILLARLPSASPRARPFGSLLH